MSEARELWFVRPRHVELRTGAPLLPLAPGEVTARALHSGVSQGTELLLYRGQGPQAFDPSLDSVGAPLFPRRYGYAWVGEIVDSRSRELAAGQRVFALRPHGDLHQLRAEDARPIPDTVPSGRATLAASLETALTVVWDAGIALGDQVVVLGGGVVGLLTGMLARRAGAARVSLVEPAPRRRACALQLGFSDARSPDADVPRGDADVVIEATGDPGCLDRAMAHAAAEAVVAVASFYGERRSPISLGDGFHRRRLQLKASQVSRLPPAKLARWDTARRFGLVLRLLTEAQLDGILEAPVPFAEAAGAYARLDAEPGAALHTVFAYR
jgi:NADPH:quinone reductase-like Zn-dependent oxidoreductase